MLTEQAANKVLNAIDLGIPDLEQLAKQAAETVMDNRWTLLTDGKLSVEEGKLLAGESRQFAATVARTAELEKARLLEIMMAQDFQDITGQLIKKIVAIIKTVEAELTQLLHDNAPPELKAVIATEQIQPENLLQGPSLPGTALAQDGVDDLLDGLGF
jgi:chemotaxis protein CheZ